MRAKVKRTMMSAIDTRPAKTPTVITLTRSANLPSLSTFVTLFAASLKATEDLYF